MAEKVRVKFEPDGFRQILMGDECAAMVRKEAEMMASRANGLQVFDEDGEPGYGASIFMGGYGGGRWIGHVSSVNFSGDFDQAQNQTLTKAANGGG
ncbi:MAG: hypothetical protein IKD70_05715 [Eggerthellaceae bacterium]|nr:hypothetical protein [Eggerthellaceae bacterium]